MRSGDLVEAVRIILEINDGLKSDKVNDNDLI